MSRCGLPTGLVWLSERKQSPNKLFQGDKLSPNKVKLNFSNFGGVESTPPGLIGLKTPNKCMVKSHYRYECVRDGVAETGQEV